MSTRNRSLVLGLGLSGGVVLGYMAYRVSHLFAMRRTQSALNPIKIQLFNRSLMSRSDTRIHLISADPMQYSKLLKGPLIGLDCEWVNNTEKRNGKVALLQIADAYGTCLLLRLNILGKIPDYITAILTNPKILKVGVNVQEDLSKLQREYGVPSSGWVDIRYLAKQFRPEQRKLGLASIAEEFLPGVKLDKDWRVSASNWEADELSSKQVNYAADDALVGVASVMAIAIESLAAYPTYNVFSSDKRYEDVVQKAEELCKPFVNTRFSSKSNTNNSSAIPRKGPNGVLDQVPKRKLHSHSVRKKPLYTNAKLQSPDGQMLSLVDTKHADWYVKKGLAEYISHDPVVVRLNFEPKGRPEGAAGEYYLIPKSNHCVVCGSSESYLKKWIVPHEYRKEFPEVMRDHQSHDVLLLCVSCHQRSNLKDIKLRQELAQMCNAPIGTEEDIKIRVDPELRRVKSAGKALLSGHIIPDNRQKQLRKILCDYYGVDEVTKEIMMKGANLESGILNEEYVPHARKVVEHFIQGQGGILALEVKWRKHFLETMKPRHMPPNWSIDHQKERLDIKASENRIDPHEYKMALGQK